jgi:hypothetical protein
MFLLDDILLSPIKGVVAVCRKVEESARQDLENQEKGTIAALGELHRRLEMGQIDEQEFDLEETRLLERIDAIGNTLHPHGEPQGDETLENEPLENETQLVETR